MRHACLIYFLLCFAVAADAQNKTNKKTYVILKTGSSFLFTTAKKGEEQISFPYSVKQGGGSAIDSSFVSNPFSPLKSMQTAINFTLEVGNSVHFVEAEFGGFTSADNGSFIGLGYGRNFYVGRRTEDLTQRDFVFKPSLHIAYNSFNNKIGSIDNRDKHIYIGSYDSGPMFTQSETDPDNSTTTTTTYTTQTLAIAYLQRSFVLSPQIAFGNNPYRHLFHWEIIAGAYFSVAETIGARFTQEATNSSKHESGSFYAIGTNGVSATYNGKNINSAPSRFSGFKIGFNIGVSTAPLKKHKVRSAKINQAIEPSPPC
jgi:hypothetical protein